MTPTITLYFQVHQPYRLRDLRITDIGTTDASYFDHEKNRQVFRKVANKCYLPANALILQLLQSHPGFKVAYSLSGVFIDQCLEYGQDVLKSFQALAQTGRVEFLGETYYHSLSSIKSLPEFCRQTRKHAETIERLFGKRPQVFRNTELIYSNHIARIVQELGYKGMLAEGADRLLCGRSPNTLFTTPYFDITAEQKALIARERWMEPSMDMRVLLKNYRLSDDVAFRFSDKSWVGFPLHAETFSDWLLASGGDCVNLFMDYETFGEHQWEDTGIFAFLKQLPQIWQERGAVTTTPSECIANFQGQPQIYDAHTPISWADTERDLSAWEGNRIQQAALDGIYALEPLVEQSQNPEMQEIWRKLQTSDHFYYMCTKYWNDGDVHRYFSPYESPYEAYRRFSHALADLKQKLTASSTAEIAVGKRAAVSGQLTADRFQCRIPTPPAFDESGPGLYKRKLLSTAHCALSARTIVNFFRNLSISQS